MFQEQKISCLLFVLFVYYSLLINCGAVEISSDKETVLRGTLPRPMQYFNFPQTKDQTTTSEKPQGVRFTYPFSTNLEGYGNNVLTHPFYPFKFDIGGLLLGAIVGFGALLLIPKISHVLVPELAGYDTPYYGSPYRRNANLLPQGMTHLVSQFDKVLAEKNINSSECLQKTICSYVQSSKAPSEWALSEENSNMIKDDISNYMINFLIDGSKLKSAIEAGKQDVDCSILYPKCPFNQDSIANGMKQLILYKNTTPEHNN